MNLHFFVDCGFYAYCNWNFMISNSNFYLIRFCFEFGNFCLVILTVFHVGQYSIVLREPKIWLMGISWVNSKTKYKLNQQHSSNHLLPSYWPTSPKLTPTAYNNQQPKLPHSSPYTEALQSPQLLAISQNIAQLEQSLTILNFHYFQHFSIYLVLQYHQHQCQSIFSIIF